MEISWTHGRALSCAHDTKHRYSRSTSQWAYHMASHDGENNQLRITRCERDDSVATCEAGARSSEKLVGLAQPHYSQGPPQQPTESPIHHPAMQASERLTHDDSPRWWCCGGTACMTMVVAAAFGRGFVCVFFCHSIFCLISGSDFSGTSVLSSTLICRFKHRLACHAVLSSDT